MLRASHGVLWFLLLVFCLLFRKCHKYGHGKLKDSSNLLIYAGLALISDYLMRRRIYTRGTVAFLW